MPKHRLLPEDQAKRNKARRAIVEAATYYSQTRGHQRRYAMRHLNFAVAVCRRQKLVTDDVLRKAGFNASTQ